MTVSFSGLITPAMKTLYTNAMSTLFYDDGCTVPCTLIYGITNYEDCDNCVYDPIGMKSANRYQSGGSVPFPFGTICPLCRGAGKKGIESTESMNLMIIWDPKQFVNVGTTQEFDDMIQVVTFATRGDELMRANELEVIHPTLSHRMRFARETAVAPCGLSYEFISCMWKKSG